MAGSLCPPEIVKVISTMGVKELLVSNVFLKLIDYFKLIDFLDIRDCPERSLTWFPCPESVPG